MNKKGMSAIIATVLLIALSVSLGLMVSKWSSGLVRKGIDRGETNVGSNLDCMELKFKLEHLVNEGIIIKNDGKKPIEGFIMRVFYTNNIEVLTYETIINSFEVIRENPPELVGANKVEIIPRIAINDDLEIVDCAKQKKVINLE